MTVYALGDRIPRVHELAYVHPRASVIGDVVIGAECLVCPGAVVRGDYGSIEIGKMTAVEDNVVIHARPGERCVVGDSVTLGHGCIIHTATVRDHAVIGMGAVVSDYAEIGEWAVVAEGAVVKNRQNIPAKALGYGIPAAVKENHVREPYMEMWGNYKKIYAGLCARYRSELRESD